MKILVVLISLVYCCPKVKSDQNDIDPKLKNRLGPYTSDFSLSHQFNGKVPNLMYRMFHIFATLSFAHFSFVCAFFRRSFFIFSKFYFLGSQKSKKLLFLKAKSDFLAEPKNLSFRPENLIFGRIFIK